MGSNFKDKINEKLATQKQYCKAFRLPEPGALLYHYAGMETIWKILESDCFLARNVRFSNDSEEYRLGEQMIKRYMEHNFPKEEQIREIYERMHGGTQMFYMICFCRKGDLLSQWRGYAKDGVSLGMDFTEEDGSQDNHVEVFTVLNNLKNREKNKYKAKDSYTRFAEMPYQVFYVDKAGKDPALEDACESFKDKETVREQLLNLVPFIKDAGFAEEAEYRILFDTSELDDTEAKNRIIMNRKIEYIDRDGRKLPNIAVELGNGEKKENAVEEIILGKRVLEKAAEANLPEEDLKQCVEDTFPKYKIQYSDSKEHIYVGEGNDQEEIMCQLEEVLQSCGIANDGEDGIKIWCRGHLPIREIIVGPGEKLDKIKESLLHYTRNTYWLRYVDIKNSELTLQS